LGRNNARRTQRKRQLREGNGRLLALVVGSADEEKGAGGFGGGLIYLPHDSR